MFRWKKSKGYLTSSSLKRLLRSFLLLLILHSCWSISLPSVNQNLQKVSIFPSFISTQVGTRDQYLLGRGSYRYQARKYLVDNQRLGDTASWQTRMLTSCREKRIQIQHAVSPGERDRGAENNDGDNNDNGDNNNGVNEKVTKSWEKSDYLLLLILSSMGLVETSFLTYTKLYGSLETLCSTSTSTGSPLSLTCGDVLTSHWASIMGIPLPALGLLAYLFIFAVSIQKVQQEDVARNVIKAKSKGASLSTLTDISKKKEQEQLPVLLISTSIMATFSTYLMGLLVFDLKTACPYCIASASLTYAMSYLAWNKELKSSRLSTTIYGGASIFVGVLISALLFLYANLEEINRFLDDSSNIKGLYTSPTTTITSTPKGSKQTADEKSKSTKKVLYLPPEITTKSSEQAFRVGRKIKDLNGRMFGAYWCSHCYEQKQAFGIEAYEKYIEYNECAPDGADSNVAFCKESKVPGYPTWQINGKLYPGQKSLDELEELLKDL